MPLSAPKFGLFSRFFQLIPVRIPIYRLWFWNKCCIFASFSLRLGDLLPMKESDGILQLWLASQVLSKRSLLDGVVREEDRVVPSLGRRL